MFRNRNMDAKNYFDFPYCTPTSVPGECRGIPGLQRDQFGGTLGGPIHKDKTFFFISYEGPRLRQRTRGKPRCRRRYSGKWLRAWRNRYSVAH